MSENLETTAEVVNTEIETDKFEVSKEEFDKLKELERNKTIRLKQEREEKAKTVSELEELRRFKQELDEKEKKKKGQYEEILTEKEELIKTLSEKAKAYDDMIEKQKQKIWEELELLKEKLTPEQLEEHNIFLEDLSDEKKIAYLKRITEQKLESFDNKVEDGERISAKTEYEKAKERGDVRAMLKYGK